MREIRRIVDLQLEGEEGSVTFPAHVNCPALQEQTYTPSRISSICQTNEEASLPSVLLTVSIQ